MDATTNRLGEPDDIAAAAHEGEEPPAGMPIAGTLPPRRGTGLEIAAVVLLTAGSFIPVIGWLTGVVLLWASSIWKWWEKLLGTLVWPLGPAVAFYLAFTVGRSSAQTCGSSGPVQVVRPDGSLSHARGGATVRCTESSSGMPPALGIALLLLLLLGPIVVDCVLLVRARRRAHGHPAPQPAGAA